MQLIILCVLLLKVHSKYILNFEQLSSDGFSILSSGYSNWNQIEQTSNDQMNLRILQSNTAAQTTCQGCCSSVSCNYGKYESNTCNCKQCKSSWSCCQNNYNCYYGTCTNGYCQCQRGWGGTYCIDIKCPNDCSGNGICTNDKCKCKDGWDGMICDYSLAKQSCQGEWVNNQCKCKEGSYGTDCSLLCKTCQNDCPKECDEYDASDHAIGVGISIGSVAGFIILMVVFFNCCSKCMRKKEVIENRDTVRNNNHVIERAQNGQNSNDNVFAQEEIQLQNQIRISKEEQHIKQVQQSIQNIPPENFIENKESNQTELRNCLICLDDIKSLMQYEIKCPYRHVFHKNCIDQWLLKHQTCPQCRGQINST